MDIKRDWPILVGLIIVFLALKRTRPVLAGHSVKEEFAAPCRWAYQKAVRGMRFVCTFHNAEALFKELRKDVLGY